MWSVTQKLQLILKGYPTCFGILLQKELNTRILRPAFSRHPRVKPVLQQIKLLQVVKRCCKK